MKLKPDSATDLTCAARLQDQHGIAITIKPILLFDGFVIGASDEIQTRKCGD
jgi:hypothetical protein